jgi:hypothetical protein
MSRILIALLSVGAIVALGATNAVACRVSKHLSAAEEAKNEREIEARRKTVQAENIGALDKMLARAAVSESDRSRAKAFRERAAHLNKAGKVDEANQLLLEAWKALGHPELFRALMRVKC